MDDLDRLYRRLVHNVRSSRPEYLAVPFTVQELYEQIVPYRHNRRELGIDTNQDYELAITRLLAGERGYVVADEAMQRALRESLASPHPDAGLFREFGNSRVSLAGVGLGATPTAPVPAARTPAESQPARRTPDEREPRGEEPRAEAAATSDNAASAGPERTEERGAAVAPGIASSGIPSLEEVAVPVGCRFCGGTLPEGRQVNYCPHCGQNLTRRHCPACASELDPDWRFCASCGRPAGP